MLEAGRAAHRFLDAFKAAVTREKNEDGTQRFAWGRDFFVRDVGLVGLRVTALAQSGAASGLRLAALHRSARLQLKCAWREETKLVFGGKSVTYSVVRTVRRSVVTGGCIELRAPRCKRDGASVKHDTVKAWVKHYWACEERRWSAAALARRVAKRTKVQKPCPAANEGKQLLSCYRAAETAAEFIRLDTLYTNPATRGSQHFPSPPSFPVPRDTLAFEVETSFDSAGGSHEWPAEFGDDTVITQSAADAAMDAGLAAAVSEHDEMEATMVDAAAAVLSGDAPQGGQRASKRVRTQTRPFDHSP